MQSSLTHSLAEHLLKTFSALGPPENVADQLQENQGHWMKYSALQIVRIDASFQDVASLAITDTEQSALAFFH